MGALVRPNSPSPKALPQPVELMNDTAKPLSRVNVPRLSDAIVRQLESMILEGSLKAGDALPPERALAEQFGVSRPSLREAIQKLAARGLLVSRQGGGTYVSDQLEASFSSQIGRAHV